jgi:hypothetical protein
MGCECDDSDYVAASETPDCTMKRMKVMMRYETSMLSLKRYRIVPPVVLQKPESPCFS